MHRPARAGPSRAARGAPRRRAAAVARREGLDLIALAPAHEMDFAAAWRLVARASAPRTPRHRPRARSARCRDGRARALDVVAAADGSRRSSPRAASTSTSSANSFSQWKYRQVDRVHLRVGRDRDDAASPTASADARASPCTRASTSTASSRFEPASVHAEFWLPHARANRRQHRRARAAQGPAVTSSTPRGARAARGPRRALRDLRRG